jgi:cytochrome P450
MRPPAPSAQAGRVSSLASVPRSDIDPFDDAVLADPYPSYRRLRDAGPVVWMRRHEVWALPRYAEVHQALRDWETFSSGAGVGLEPEFNELPGGILGSDPPEHDRLRRFFHATLGPRAMRTLEEQLRERADALVGRLVARRSFDAVGDLAEPFVVSVVGDLVGLPPDRRSELLANSTAGFDRFGPPNRRFHDAEAGYRRLIDYVTTVAIPGRLARGGWGAGIYLAADAGDIDPRECRSLMLVYTWPSVDTSVAAISNAVRLFARHPDQWDLVRADPDLVPAAFDEALRHDAPAQILVRATTRDINVGGIELPAGARVMLLVGSANRDERHYPQPERFDVRRQPTDHLAFGHGIHHCLGAPLARLEGHAILHALAARVARFRVDDERLHLNNIVRRLGTLRVEVEPTAGGVTARRRTSAAALSSNDDN